ncbi:3-deoxy-D-manno-octulosonic acid kinase [Gallaecimonas kandeliae]|uniref:3-deoxy-D-manno-octulosonic acid kinase n=1 Tax=Gallaecimonas kandeliae TaxID=3029055 RepID=UPI0026490162|nr:3-deoxy-D-manno-octulosonic acid kinase [Gallaecimonas kandeliae]WKE64736.1 3-deoxy-D-manno-octulosonic acid kinase [Gallaecimonas kandeliae]
MNSQHQLWSQNHFLLHDKALLPQVGPDEFRPRVWRERGAVTGTSTGRGTTYFLRQGEAHWVLRHYRRGGLVGKLVKDSYLFLGINNSRPVAEYKLLARLHDLGLPVPKPVAAHVERRGLFYKGDILIERIQGARDLVAWLQKAELAEGQWQAIGALVRRFHDAGVFHADLNAHNILLGEAGGLWLIDFDRGRLRKSGVWKEDNLARLLRSFNKEKGRLPSFHWDQERDWPALMAGYEKGA